MDRIPFDPKELEIVGYMPAFNPRAPKIPIYNTPVSKRENYLMFLNGETPHWLPHMNDQFLFLPECVPDNWCRGMVTASKPVSIDMFGGKDMFGVEWEYIPKVGGSMVRPGKPYVDDLDHWEDYVPFPNIEEWDWAGCAEAAKEKLNDGRLVKVSMMTGLFERLISFVDMTDAMIALIDEDTQPAVHRLFDKLCILYDQMFAKFEEYFHADAIWFHDDWGSQRSPFFSADTVREMILPYLKRCVDSAHKHGMRLELHSCGHIEQLVPVMIEAGCDMWNGQPMNDKLAVAKACGGKIAVDSYPNVNKDMSEAQVREEIQHYLDDFKGLRTYGARHMDEHPLEYQISYELSRKMFS